MPTGITTAQIEARLAELLAPSRLEVIEQAGAWPHAEQSAKVNQLIVDYLRSADEALPAPPG